MSCLNRFVGADSLPSRLSDFEVEHFFALSRSEIEALAAHFRADRARVGATVQLVILRATGRPFDRSAAIPRRLLRAVCDSLKCPPVTIASLRSLYERRPTLYEHQRWAREHLGLREFDRAAHDELGGLLALAARDAAHVDDLIATAQRALFECKVVIPGSRRLLLLAREAFSEAETLIANAIGRKLQPAEIRRATEWAYADHPDGQNHIEWLKAGPQGNKPSTTIQTVEKIKALKALGVHGWTLEGVAMAKQRAYAAHVQMRRPSMTARIVEQRQTIELVCFLRVSLLELTDSALHQLSRRSRELLRWAAVRAKDRRIEGSMHLLQLAAHAKAILHDESKDWRDRVIEARGLLHAVQPRPTPFAAEIRKALAQDKPRVHACLAAMLELDIDGGAGDPAVNHWRSWLKLQADGATALPPDFDKSGIGASWRGLVADPDPQLACGAFAACTMLCKRAAILAFTHKSESRARSRTQCRRAE